MRRLLRLILLILALGVVVAAPLGGAWYLLRGRDRGQGALQVEMPGSADVLMELVARVRAGDLQTPASDDPTPVTFVVEPGETAAQIAQRLQDEGLVRDADLFRLLLRVRGADTRLEAGQFELRRNMTMDEIIVALQHGRPPTVRVTIPEGLRAEEVATILAAQGLINPEEFLSLVRTGEGFDYAFLRDRPAGVTPSLEGYLFPDTYEIPTEYDTPQVLGLLLENFDRRFDAEMRRKASEAGMTIHEVVTLASIVERETVIPEEAPLIASVYRNRLNIEMKLDADPTVQYAMGYDATQGTWWRTLLLEDYTYPSPYNTYLSVGLPPGPICSPGLGALRATLEPADAPYLFFVANGRTKDGSHIFATTFEEHQRNIERYRP